MGKRVVITGMGVCAPNAVGLEQFKSALSSGRNGIHFQQELQDLNFGCQIAGKPDINKVELNKYFNSVQLKSEPGSGLVYGVIAGTDAWKDAGLEIKNDSEPDWETGVIFGTGLLGVDRFRESVLQIDQGQVRRLGSTAVVHTMASGISAYLGGILGCGNQVTTNSSACTTGTEGILIAWERIRQGSAQRMLVGSTSDSGPYIWGGFDALRILPRAYNDNPGKASRPMSATATGFVPGSGAGALVLESLESARNRGARIYAEVLGGTVNSGGQRQGGSMTAPNPFAVQRCIQHSLEVAGIEAREIDAINGHLTATSKDAEEIMNWSIALGLRAKEFPYINSFKSTIGHCLAAAGSIESVGAVLQLKEGQVFGNVNCHDLDPAIEDIIHRSRVPENTIPVSPEIIAKASFGFGDVNACVIFKKISEEI
ncbi:beta-ketoacyl-[acyl-carrier-protein] synthase family protein [Zeaxanthinibacter enoshimensis]|uniref:3-oxoacyl-[acyl-carrier-protein] synthase 1 n=1 Tax=Zeaxanthinibacter enoshimensis TaxID=392009 RepID=A0A4R6TLG9_9FLAO|nr:beta-ketoacyl-[acyl-carrier-protein] synthase family protein [Zeaxanthinibacter enoshimensis]TDQ31352.1 3-oxoacyl-(acyl-carrier-protein) synthase [Zeaxanthinibacter enoshimensis]